ncbi:aspartate aminotransferase family protein [Ferruginivarius sediminum]|uniref:Aspartate aminotransferase family protein n=1 Tax=Ferruginivarius sediminum TaxID=2661937 RepID=A0A369TBR7_9PROT|nr:aspartate aminotransferase family protein [Ferruginivarius sediminum]RDD61617.1 aspartate aminotransferase family protein [Ferruginivarius sediminum]
MEGGGLPQGFEATPNNLEPFWMPFTWNRRFKEQPKLITGADGMHYTTHDGREVLDGTAGLWCVNAGHNRRRIVEAVQQQVAQLDYAPTFQLGHPLTFQLANQLVQMAPQGAFDHVFFANSGSEAVDSALKIAMAYHRARGQGERRRFIGRERGYHGVGFGGISVGGITNNRRMFAELPGTDHMRHTFDLKEQAYSRGQPDWGAHLADDLERMCALHGAETIAGVIVEPVAGSTGVLLPPKGYLQRLREICDKHGILLIFDEVITGFGRLGSGFAAEYFGVTPDIITLAKGITNGVVPMGAVMVREGIYDSVMAGAERGGGTIEFFHGYTYTGHPLACAAGLATLEIYKEEELFQRAARLAPVWEDALHNLKGTRHIKDLRNLGLIAGIELESRPDAPGQRGYDAFTRAWEKGLLIRVTGDIIALSPPLILDEGHIDRIFQTLKETLEETD